MIETVMNETTRYAELVGRMASGKPVDNGLADVLMAAGKTLDDLRSDVASLKRHRLAEAGELDRQADDLEADIEPLQAKFGAVREEQSRVLEVMHSARREAQRAENERDELWGPADELQSKIGTLQYRQSQLRHEAVRLRAGISGEGRS